LGVGRGDLEPKWPVNEGSLAAFLVDMAGVPLEEASLIADESVRECANVEARTRIVGRSGR
jgi:hypothetical protein